MESIATSIARRTTLLVGISHNIPELQHEWTIPTALPLRIPLRISSLPPILHGGSEQLRIVPVTLVNRLLRMRKCVHVEFEPSCEEFDELPESIAPPVLMEGRCEVVVHAAFVCLLQLRDLRGRAVGEELFKRIKIEVVDLEEDGHIFSHEFAPRGCAEFISGLVGDANDTMVRLDESGGLVDGVFLGDHVVRGVLEARRAADPGVLGH